MSKFKASIPRKNPSKGMAHYVFSIKDENGCRIESVGLMKSETIKKVYAVLMEDRQEFGEHGQGMGYSQAD